MARRGILLIETSTSIGRVGLSREDSMETCRLANDRNHARDLVPAIGRLLDSAALTVKDLAHIGVALGPGGYTGLRVGTTTAKTLSFAGGAVLHALPTFDLLVRTLPDEAKNAILLADALKDQAYSEEFERDSSGNWQSVQPLGIRPMTSVREWFTGGKAIIVEGKLKSKLSSEAGIIAIEDIPDEVLFRAMNECVLSGIYRVANLANLEPLYLRGSSAEEKRATEESPVVT